MLGLLQQQRKRLQSKEMALLRNRALLLELEVSLLCFTEHFQPIKGEAILNIEQEVLCLTVGLL